MKNSAFDEIKSQTPLEIQLFVDKSFEIADEVDYILENQGKNRAYLAAKLEKNESEISKWLSGLHNLTIKSITKIEATLGETIITTPSKEEKKYEGIINSLERKIQKLQDKIEKLTKENDALKEIFLRSSYEHNVKFYIVDSVSQKLSSQSLISGSGSLKMFIDAFHLKKEIGWEHLESRPEHERALSDFLSSIQKNEINSEYEKLAI